MLDGATIRRRVTELAADLTAGHPDGLVAVVLLPSSVLFASDLLRHVDRPCTVEVVAPVPRSRAGVAPRPRLTDLGADVAGQDVVVIEALVDTGRTVHALRQALARHAPRSVQVCALLARPARFVRPVTVDHLGFAVGDGYVLGYGLGYAGRYRNLDRLVEADLDRLHADPDAYRPALYPDSGG